MSDLEQQDKKDNSTKLIKKSSEGEEEDDLLLLNEEATNEPQSDKPSVNEIPTDLKDTDFDIKEYQGFPMDDWIRYQGSINDNKQKRRVSIANLEKFTMRFNKSGDDDMPEWDVITLQYYPITVKAWQKRQSDIALVEDKQREVGAIELQLSEMQSSMRERYMMRTGGNSRSSDISKLNLEDLQKNVNILTNLQKNMKQEFQRVKNEADRYAFKIYFHKPEEFDKIRADDLDDVIGACDWKQVNGPANLKPSKSSPTQKAPGVS